VEYFIGVEVVGVELGGEGGEFGEGFEFFEAGFCVL